MTKTEQKPKQHFKIHCFFIKKLATWVKIYLKSNLNVFWAIENSRITYTKRIEKTKTLPYYSKKIGRWGFVLKIHPEYLLGF
jgi:hypothetical protein